MVDPRSVFNACQVCDKLIEALCDCGASVSCLSPVIFAEKQRDSTEQNLKAANGLTIGVKGIIRIPLTVWNKHYEHELHVLENTETDCLVGLVFLESNQCDPLSSRMELRLPQALPFGCIIKFWLSHQYGLSSRRDRKIPGISRPYQNASSSQPKLEETTHHPQRCLRGPKQSFNRKRIFCSQ